ncbi:MAG TPA: efflux RND transporter permease subunit, partial [Gammaproteobacteria bacterium]|nr:efflux RND transporter permease subunit [Gammaproteobacteria bacterium]
MTVETAPVGMKQSGVIAWFAANPVAANLLVLLIVFCGGISVFTIRKSIMPQFESNMVRVGVSFLGATPEEVEEGVILRVEEAVQDLNGVKKITSVAREGYGQVMIEVEAGYDLNEVLDQVKSRVDGISTFPQETERPIVEKQEFQFEVMWISVYGDIDPVTLKEITGEVRDELLSLPAVTAVNVVGDRDYEISIE